MSEESDSGKPLMRLEAVPLTDIELAQWTKIRRDNPKLLSPASSELRLLATITELRKLMSDQSRVYHDSQWRQLKEAQADNARLRAVLTAYVYETTHLSPERDDGSHDCRVPLKLLTEARAALQSSAPQGASHPTPPPEDGR